MSRPLAFCLTARYLAVQCYWFLAARGTWVVTQIPAAGVRHARFLPLPKPSFHSSSPCCPALTSLTDRGYLTPLEECDTFCWLFACSVFPDSPKNPDKTLLSIYVNCSGTDTKGGANDPARHHHRTARHRRHAGLPGNREELTRQELGEKINDSASGQKNKFNHPQ